MNPFAVLLRHRNFRLFWLGQTLSLVGTWMQSMAQGWLALELTDSAFMVGLVATASSVPIVALSLLAGAFVDRSDKLRVVTVAQALMLGDAALLWWFTATGHVTIGWLLALAALNGVISAVEIPARQSLVIELVGREDLRPAIALNSSGFNLARILGPWVGAFVIHRFGIAACFGVNAVSYLAVLGGLARIRLPAHRPARRAGNAIAEAREGLRYLVRTPVIAPLMRMVTVYSILGIPYLTLMPVVARDVLQLGPDGYGYLLSCVGVGGLTGALGIAAVGERVRKGTLLVGASYAFPALLLLFAAVRSAPIAYVILFFVGLSMILNNAISNALLQTIVPDAMRGRLMAAYSLVVVGLSQVVGSFAAGAVARALGAPVAIAAGALLMLGYAALVFGRHREIRGL